MTIALGAAYRLALGSMLALSVADVMPHCGGPEVVVRNPGEDCGHHGPRWRGDCHAPAACYTMDHGAPRCTIECATNADCAKLGAGFTCSAQGRHYERPEDSTAHRVCATTHE